jgi:hypothetical protein
MINTCSVVVGEKQQAIITWRSNCGYSDVA